MTLLLYSRMANEKKFLGPAGVERLWSHVKEAVDSNATTAITDDEVDAICSGAVADTPLYSLKAISADEIENMYKNGGTEGA